MCMRPFHFLCTRTLVEEVELLKAACWLLVNPCLLLMPSALNFHIFHSQDCSLGLWFSRLEPLNFTSAIYFPGFMSLCDIYQDLPFCQGLPWRLSGKESTWQCRRCGFSPWVGKIPWRRKRQPTPIFLPWKSHEQGSLVGYSPQGHERVWHDLETKQQPVCQSSHNDLISQR